MFPPPPAPAVGAVQGLIVAAAFLGLGYLLATAVMARRGADRLTLWALAFPAFVAFCLFLMLLHMVTGGAVLSNPWLTRAITGAVAAVLLLRIALAEREAVADGTKKETWAAGILVVLAVIVWGNPVARVFPLSFGIDAAMHLGWASQLLNGESTPSAPIAKVPNAYPWLHHATLAFLARFTPGGRAFHAIQPLQFLQITGTVLALFALGRKIRPGWTTGIAAVLFGALTGGFGWMLVRGPELDVYPLGAGKYWGDLVWLRSYNFAFHNILPPFPRDLSFALVVVLLLLLVRGMSEQRMSSFVVAGVVLGLIGLIGAETFIVGVGVSALTILLSSGIPKIRTAVYLLLPAFAIYATWLLPLLINYLRLDGFVNLSRLAAVDRPPWAILASWGIVTPFAVFGAGYLVREAVSAHRQKGRWEPTNDASARVLGALLAVAGGAVVASAVIPWLLGTAFVTLGRGHRYWPLVSLAMVLYAAVGASWLFRRAKAFSRSIAVALVAATLLLALPSPLLASLAIPEKFPDAGGMTSRSVRGDPDTLLNVLSPAPGRVCNVAAPRNLSYPIFSYTGYRLVLFIHDELGGPNLARVRWRGIYDHIPTDDERLTDNRVLTGGSIPPDEWRSTAEKYDLNMVVVPEARAGAPGFANYPTESVNGSGYVVVRLQPCR